MRRARAAPVVDAAFENEIGDDQSVQDEIPPAPRRRGRGRGRGRVRAAAAQQPEQTGYHQYHPQKLHLQREQFVLASF